MEKMFCALREVYNYHFGELSDALSVYLLQSINQNEKLMSCKTLYQDVNLLILLK